MMLLNHRLDTAIPRLRLILHRPLDRQNRKPATGSKEFPMALQRQTRSGGKRHFAALGAADLDGTRGLQPHRVRRFYCCSTGGSSREEDLAL
jgi:hypothetical protein